LLVPSVPDTAQIDITGPSGRLHSVRAGMNTPQVTITMPNGGEHLSGNTIPVAWVASDADGDALTFTVQYSADNGATWEAVADNITGTSVEVHAINVVASNQGRFRVWVSDGIHTSSDVSDGPFTVPNAVPEARIIAPADGVVVARGQTVTLRARAYDRDVGTVPSKQIEWLSSIDGSLGSGRSLSVADLSVGAHAITLRVDDGAGGVASDHIDVTVVGDLAQLPAGCPGDCSGDTLVTVDELVTGVRIALGSAQLNACAAFDMDRSGTVTVDELVAAVNAALHGCP
jgi:hypothetical protein